MKKSNNKTTTDATAGSGKNKRSANNTAPGKTAKQTEVEATVQVTESDSTDQGKSDLIEQLSEAPIERVEEPQKVRPKKELREQFRDSHKSFWDRF